MDVNHGVNAVVGIAPANDQVDEQVIGIVGPAGQRIHVFNGDLKAAINPSPVGIVAIDSGQGVTGDTHGKKERYFSRLLREGSTSDEQLRLELKLGLCALLNHPQ